VKGTSVGVEMFAFASPLRVMFSPLMTATVLPSSVEPTIRPLGLLAIVTPVLSVSLVLTVTVLMLRLASPFKVMVVPLMAFTPLPSRVDPTPSPFGTLPTVTVALRFELLVTVTTGLKVTSVGVLMAILGLVFNVTVVPAMARTVLPSNPEPTPNPDGSVALVKVMSGLVVELALTDTRPMEKFAFPSRVMVLPTLSTFRPSNVEPACSTVGVLATVTVGLEVELETI
jgi:hypothetical protein